MKRYLSIERAAELEQQIAKAVAEFPATDVDTHKHRIAQSYNFQTWKQLAFYLARSTGDQEDFLNLACLNYAPSDHPKNWQRARDLLNSQPRLSGASIYHAAAVGLPATVTKMLEENPALVNQLGGPRDWPPILYACYSRINIPGNSTRDVVKVLLDFGADPNAHYMWGGQYCFSALTGAFGEGEQGPIRQPPHAEVDTLVPLLLSHGADPNDGQALYNRMFTGSTTHLKVLLAAGLSLTDRPNWLDVNRHGVYYKSKLRMLTYLLDHAIERAHLDVVRVLLTAGATLSRSMKNKSYRMAMLNGEGELAELLLEYGVTKKKLNSIELFVSAVMSDTLDQLGKSRSQLMVLCKKSQRSIPALFADAINRDRTAAINHLMDLGWDINDDSTGKTVLHDAAYLGRLSLVQRLIEMGADPTTRDARFGSTPHQWALVNDQADVAEYLRAITPSETT